MPEKNKKKPLKVGLALSGGSALGICHAGAIKALREHRITIDCVSGTSAGAIAAVCLAFGVPFKKMTEVTRELNWSNISTFGYSKMGINSNRPVGEIIRNLIGNARIEEAFIPLAIVATDIETGQEVILRKGNVAEAVMASTCIPGVFIPIDIKGRKLVDGGLTENLPLSPLKSMGVDVRIGVDLGRWRTLKKPHNIVEVITNSYSILTTSQNISIPAQAEILIEPHLEKFTSSDFEKYDQLLEVGYQATERKIAEIKKYLDVCPHKLESFGAKIINFFKFQHDK